MNSEVHGHDVYSDSLLRVYDAYFFWYVSRLFWRCPARHVIEHYNDHLSSNHLDVGVGTGYCLHKSRFPVGNPSITLMDMSENCLRFTARRLAGRYQDVRTHVGDVLAKQEFPDLFDSIAINYILAVLPGTMADKRPVFENMRGLLKPGGTLFGSTPLYDYGSEYAPAKARMDNMERRKLFSISGDTEAGLRRNLEATFGAYSLKRVGCVALFAAQA
jgi:ubiquinone/menaquinone biosynthesis C-methylase UbiE